MRCCVLILAMLCVAAGGCSGHYVRGGVNGVTYDMSLDRPAVPGSDVLAIEIRMDPGGDGTTGTLWVDRISFGAVVSGDHVQVTDEAVVLVNGKRRAPH